MPPETTVAVAANALRKAKSNREKTYIKRVCEELNNIDKLLQDVLNVHSSVTNGGTVLCKHALAAATQGQ